MEPQLGGQLCQTTILCMFRLICSCTNLRSWYVLLIFIALSIPGEIREWKERLVCYHKKQQALQWISTICKEYNLLNMTTSLALSWRKVIICWKCWFVLIYVAFSSQLTKEQHLIVHSFVTMVCNNHSFIHIILLKVNKPPSLESTGLKSNDRSTEECSISVTLGCYHWLLERGRLLVLV